VIKKPELKKEGFDPGVVNDTAYVLLPGALTYQRLTADLFTDIQNGKYRF
jgi:hypothetical protein